MLNAAAGTAVEEWLALPDPVWVWDPEFLRISHANPAALSFWGEPTLADLLEHEFDPQSSYVSACDGLARSLTDDRQRTLLLDIDGAGSAELQTCHVAACMLDDGRRGLLIRVAAVPARPGAFARFVTVARAAPAALCLVDEAGQIVFENDEAVRLIGSSSDVLSVQTLFFDDGQGADLLRRAARNGTAGRTLSLRSRHGARSVRATLRRVKDPDTGETAFVLLLRDVADLRARDSEVQAQAQQIETMLGLVSDFQWRLDRDQRVIHLSSGFQQATGAPANRFIGRRWPNIVSEVGIRQSPDLEAALAGDAPWRDLTLDWPSDPVPIRFRLSGLPVLNRAGEVTGWRGIAQRVDVPDPIAAKQPKRSAAVSAVLDAIDDGVLLLDGDGYVVEANAAAYELFAGRAPLEGHSFAQLFAAGDQSEVEAYVAGLESDTLSSVYEDGLEAESMAPEAHPLSIHIARLAEADTEPADASSSRRVQLVARVRDLTPMLRRETDLRQALEEAREINEKKSDFVAMVSHELRTPLNAIIGFSELMREERFGPIGNEKYLAYISSIHAGGQHLLNLINDLLDLAKVQAGRFEPSFERVDLAAIIDECANFIKPGAADDSISIRVALPDGLPPIVADPRGLRQILMNLLSNAVKFTQGGGQVQVSARLSPTGEIILSVADTGVGMTEDELRRALEPFHQIRTAQTRGKRGTGLGLPLAKALAEANKASFRIASTPDAGTTIELVFPSTQVLQD